ncbi:hypothetical protein D8B26_000899 [Coccidioides posadasii str. Silveira]|uniref:protein-ribulosamine 3-kinase n=2 Tax=Coccidioides posadasii TaxID=199306 RepID=E9CRD5_COCPS|nr:phosphotransferase [Coccidioides posadasii str. Silveira]KMM64039.1 fructosamine-3-kinase [Coccidioides posadasii RMSCC 3488]QVM06188.1 hypothetical protein D8B26_000899 [Coccidioides posadasii str. Silveira]
MSYLSHHSTCQSILAALSLSALDPSKATLSTHGRGSGFASTAHLRVLVPNPENPQAEIERHFFIKTSLSSLSRPHVSSGGPHPDPAPDPAMEMFRGECASLNAIAAVVPALCPRGLAWGKLGDDGSGGWFLATEFLDLGGPAGRGGRSSSGVITSRARLARRLAQLHCTPAPPAPTSVVGDEIVNLAEKRKKEEEKNDDNNVENSSGVGDEDDGRLQFGFPVPTFCGDVRQPNEFRRSWAEFYADQRLRTVLAESEKRNGPDKELRDLVERVAVEVVPRLLGDGHLGYDRRGNGSGVVPVVVHGDLWSGNVGRGKILRARISDDDAGFHEEKEDIGDVVYDPSACYAHSEFELGIMNMFGGFGRDFYEEYHCLVPKTEPVDEYVDRVKLYELYHHLNHHTIFGGGYRSGAVSIMQKLLSKYGHH